MARAQREHGQLVVHSHRGLLARQRGRLERDCSVPKAAHVARRDAEHTAEAAAPERLPGARLRQGRLRQQGGSGQVRRVGRLRARARGESGMRGRRLALVSCKLRAFLQQNRRIELGPRHFHTPPKRIVVTQPCLADAHASAAASKNDGLQVDGACLAA